MSTVTEEQQEAGLRQVTMLTRRIDRLRERYEAALAERADLFRSMKGSGVPQAKLARAASLTSQAVAFAIEKREKEAPEKKSG